LRPGRRRGYEPKRRQRVRRVVPYQAEIHRVDPLVAVIVGEVVERRRVDERIVRAVAHRPGIDRVDQGPLPEITQARVAHGIAEVEHVVLGQPRVRRGLCRHLEPPLGHGLGRGVRVDRVVVGPDEGHAIRATHAFTRSDGDGGGGRQRPPVRALVVPHFEREVGRGQVLAIGQAEHSLKTLPVFDGLIAAGKRLYLSTVDGKVTCFAGR